MTIYAGFEIEVEVDRKYNIQHRNIGPTLLQLAKQASDITGVKNPKLKRYHHAEPSCSFRNWKMEQDCSLYNGAEFISPPIPVDISIKKLFRFFEYLEDSKCTTTDNCGLHVNMSSTNKTLDNVSLPTMLSLMNQRLLFKLWKNRIEIGNSYINNLSKIIKACDYKIACSYLSKQQPHREKIHNITNCILERKYNFINLRTIQNKKYLEIRIMGGKDYHKKRNEIKQTVNHFANILNTSQNKTQYTCKKIVSYANRIYETNDDSKIFEITWHQASLELIKKRIKLLKNIHKYNKEKLVDMIRKSTFDINPPNESSNSNYIHSKKKDRITIIEYFCDCIYYIEQYVRTSSTLGKEKLYKYVNYHFVKYICKNYGITTYLSFFRTENLLKYYYLYLPEDESRLNLPWILNVLKFLPKQHKVAFINSLSPDLLDFLTRHKQPGMINLVKARKKIINLSKGKNK